MSDTQKARDMIDILPAYHVGENIDSYEEVIRERLLIDHDNPRLWFLLGSYLRIKGNLNEARAALLNALNLSSSSDTNTLLELALLLSALDMPNEAQKLWRVVKHNIQDRL